MPGQYDLTPEDLAQTSALSHQQVSPQTGGLEELRPLPWWKRRLLAMQTAQAGMPQQGSTPPSGSSSVDNWQSLGGGVGNLIRGAIGFKDGGAVQGPTMALIGEGNEPEYVVPESKVAPWIARIQQTGAVPNPAEIPSGDYMPPPPVILPPTTRAAEPPPPVILPPQMCSGGKVMPKMAGGGMVLPRRVEDVMPAPMDYFNVGDDMVGYQDPATFAPPPVSIPRPQRPMPQMPAPSFEAMKRREAHLMQGPPQPKWYERLVGTPPGDGPMDMRPGVAGYSMAGRAARGVLSSVLPFGRKMDEFKRKDAALRAAEETEAAQNAATQKQYETQRADTVARSQMDANDARRIEAETRTNKLNAPPPPADPYKDMVEVDEATGKRAGVVPGLDGKYRIYKQNVRVPAIPPPPTPTPETPDQAFARRKKEAVQLGLKEGTPDYLNYMAGRNISKPAKPAGGGSGSISSSALSAEDEKTAQNLANGGTSVEKIKSKNRDAIVNRAIELGYSKPREYSASERGALASIEQLGKDIEALLSDQESLKSAVGIWDGTVGAAWNKKFGGDQKVMSARQVLGRITATLAKAQGGTSFTPTEKEQLETYTPVASESNDSVLTKLEGLQQWMENKRKAMEGVEAQVSGRSGAGGVTPPVTGNVKPPDNQGRITMEFRDGKQRLVKPENVKAAEAAGAKRI